MHSITMVTMAEKLHVHVLFLASADRLVPYMYMYVVSFSHITYSFLDHGTCIPCTF